MPKSAGATRPGRRGSQVRAAARSCRTPRPRRRRPSRRAACSAPSRRPASIACGRPKPAARRTGRAAPARPAGATAGGLPDGAPRPRAARAHSRWHGAMLVPTSNAPARPGPVVTAMASMSAAVRRACWQDTVEQRQHAPDVIARGKFRHHPAVGLVHLDLGVQRLAKQSSLAVQECDAGLVAGGLDPEDPHATECTRRPAAPSGRRPRLSS